MTPPWKTGMTSLVRAVRGLQKCLRFRRSDFSGRRGDRRRRRDPQLPTMKACRTPHLPTGTKGTRMRHGFGRTKVHVNLSRDKNSQAFHPIQSKGPKLEHSLSPSLSRPGRSSGRCLLRRRPGKGLRGPGLLSLRSCPGAGGCGLEPARWGPGATQGRPSWGAAGSSPASSGPVPA